MRVKRLRVFVGPNGSGKSTITKIVNDADVHLGVYVNADELKKIINDSGQLDFSSYISSFDINDFWQCFSKASLFHLADGEKIIGVS